MAVGAPRRAACARGEGTGFAVALAAAAIAAAAAGCGAAPARDRGVSVLVTRDFGRAGLGAGHVARPSGHPSAIELLRRFGGRRAPSGLDWTLYVNGVAAAAGDAGRVPRPGDRFWWDLHSRSAPRTPAVVGAFPEPFVSGVGGRRLPVTLGCAAGASAACDRVSRTLESAGVVAGRSAPGIGAPQQTLRVLVGQWSALRSDRAAQSLERGPEASGVFARPAAGGGELLALDAGGEVVRRLGAGSGLVAATRVGGAQPTWFVTGTDDAGTAAAAAAFAPRFLRARFAIAATGGATIALPVDEAAARRSPAQKR